MRAAYHQDITLHHFTHISCSWALVLTATVAACVHVGCRESRSDEDTEIPADVHSELDAGDKIRKMTEMHAHTHTTYMHAHS